VRHTKAQLDKAGGLYKVKYALPCDDYEGNVFEFKKRNVVGAKPEWLQGPQLGLIKRENEPIFQRPGYRRPAAMLRENADTQQDYLGLKIGVEPRCSKHWLFDGLASIWAPPDRGRKWTVTRSTSVSSPLFPMAIGPFAPAIMELPGSLGRVIVTTFHISRGYPDTMQLLSNFIHHHHQTASTFRQNRQAFYAWLSAAAINGDVSLEYQGSIGGTSGGTETKEIKGGVGGAMKGAGKKFSARKKVYDIPDYVPNPNPNPN